MDVGLASTESQAGQAGFEASQTLEILTSPGCIQDCISRKRSEDKLRVVGVNEASMGVFHDLSSHVPVVLQIESELFAFFRKME